MADETTVAAEPTSEETAKTTGEAGTADTSAAPIEGVVKETKTFTQAELDDIIEKRLAKEREKADKKAADARAEAERKAAEEQGEYKKLYEETKAQAEKAEAEKAAVERERLIDRIALRHQLPDELRDRLRGESEEELEADAKALAKLITKPAVTAPNLDAERRGASSPNVLDSAKQAELAQRFRIPGIH